MAIVDVIEESRSGVAQILYETDHQRVGSGSAFLVDRGLMTNSHVLRPDGRVDAFAIRFPDTDPDDSSSFIRLLPADCQQRVRVQSPVECEDYAFIEIDEPEFAGRHRFQLGDSTEVRVGQQVVFLGFPFGMPQLTAHVGWVASKHSRRGTDIIQIDGSVNGGNSGGPLIDPENGRVIGIVTRAVTGIIAEQFDHLIATLRTNQEILAQQSGSVSICGVDPVQGLRASQAAMEQIARNLKRSANVGIGYANSINSIRDHIQSGTP